jgi:hypothetical protein
MYDDMSSLGAEFEMNITVIVQFATVHSSSLEKPLLHKDSLVHRDHRDKGVKARGFFKKIIVASIYFVVN